MEKFGLNIKTMMTVNIKLVQLLIDGASRLLGWPPLEVVICILKRYVATLGSAALYKYELC